MIAIIDDLYGKHVQTLDFPDGWRPQVGDFISWGDEDAEQFVIVVVGWKRDSGSIRPITMVPVLRVATEEQFALFEQERVQAPAAREPSSWQG